MDKIKQYIFPVVGLGLLLEEEKEPSYLTAAVGEYVVFNCDLDFPHEIPIPYILHWNRDVSITLLFNQSLAFNVSIMTNKDIRKFNALRLLIQNQISFYLSNF